MIPERIAPQNAADYLAVLSRAIFQAGLSWKLIESKWDAYLRLFEGFDPVLVAAFDDTDVDRIMEDGGIVRTRKKIVATIANARAFREIERTHGDVRTYLRSFDGYGALSADLRTRFAFLGELSVYYFLFRVGEPVPHFEEWQKTVAGDHPRMREMVELARSQGVSPETP